MTGGRAYGRRAEPGERPFAPTAAGVILVEALVLAALLIFQLRYGL